MTSLAKAIGSPSYKINSEQRQTLHLSAVFVNNFTNQLYRIAHELVDKQGLDFEILNPLIIETAKKYNSSHLIWPKQAPQKDAISKH